MKLPFRIITARRFENIQAIEVMHDLHFVRGTVRDAIDFLDEEIDVLRNSYAYPDGSIKDPMAIEHLSTMQTLRVNLLTVLYRAGGA